MHQFYKANSPYYRGILASEGRYLSADVVESILRDHSIPLDEYLADHVGHAGDDGLPEKTEAVLLVSWLGY